MDRLISEQDVLNVINEAIRLGRFYCGKEQTINEIKAIPSADLDLKQSFKDGYDTALNDLEDRFEALLNNNPWYVNAISDILQIINEQKGSD